MFVYFPMYSTIFQFLFVCDLFFRLSCSYLEKFTEFLSLFVSIHLKRFEPNTQFPTAELLDLLIKYTSMQVYFDFAWIFLHILV